MVNSSQWGPLRLTLNAAGVMHDADQGRGGSEVCQLVVVVVVAAVVV